jgi:hypothetical protein
VNRNHALVDTEFPIISTLFFLLGKKFVSSVRPIGLGGYIRNGVNVAEKL